MFSRKTLLMALLFVGVFALMSCQLLGQKKANVPPTEPPTVAPSPLPSPTLTPTSAAVSSPPPPTEAPTTPPLLWEQDDAPKDLRSCQTGEPVLPKYMERINPKVYVDYTHISAEVVPLNNAHVNLGGQMCAYKFTITYDHPFIEDTKKAAIEGVFRFKGGTTIAEYRFSWIKGEPQWKPQIQNEQTGAAVVPTDLSDFHLEIQGDQLIAQIPCYAIPRANGQTLWQYVAYNRDANGAELYCDIPGEPGQMLDLLSPTIYWDGKTPLTIVDNRDDVLDLTQHLDTLQDPYTDIQALQVTLAPRNSTQSLEIASFPPPELTHRWSVVFRLNLKLVEQGILLCGRGENGIAGYIDPKLNQTEPDNPLAQYNEGSVGPGCIFAPPALPPDGCVFVSSDYYTTNRDANIQHKDRIDRVGICYQTP